MSYLADHGSHGIGLRLTNDGYLTADVHMDLPPLRCVLIDPYTGLELCVLVCVCRGGSRNLRRGVLLKECMRSAPKNFG